jgi:hypothetical protein
MRWLSVVAVAVLCVGCGDKGPVPGADAAGGAAATAETASSNGAQTVAKPAAPAAPAFREVTVPEGTTLRLDLASAVASDSSHVEEPVRATLREPIVVSGKTVLPVGTELTGVVTDVERSGRVKGRARVAFHFTSLHVGSERYAVRTAPIAEQAAATKGEDAKKIGIGAGIGAAIGAIAGGGSGAAKGAAIGGAGGTGVVLATRGKEVRLGPGATIATHLTESVTVRVKS